MPCGAHGLGRHSVPSAASSRPWLGSPGSPRRTGPCRRHTHTHTHRHTDTHTHRHTHTHCSHPVFPRTSLSCLAARMKRYPPSREPVRLKTGKPQWRGQGEGINEAKSLLFKKAPKLINLQHDKDKDSRHESPTTGMNPGMSLQALQPLKERGYHRQLHAHKFSDRRNGPISQKP